jgi:streptogramin lyase
MGKKFLKKFGIWLSVIFTVSSMNIGMAIGDSEEYSEKTYTIRADFDLGTYFNVVNTGPEELELDDSTKPFGFIWVAVSSKGTIVKIDTETGNVMGEYWTSPLGQPKNPSRTTVDKNGSVWVANRDGNSVTRVCLPESGLWIDKNGN